MQERPASIKVFIRCSILSIEPTREKLQLLHMLEGTRAYAVRASFVMLHASHKKLMAKGRLGKKIALFTLSLHHSFHVNGGSYVLVTTRTLPKRKPVLEKSATLSFDTGCWVSRVDQTRD